MKDFAVCPWFYRITLGRLAARHEFRMVLRLQGLAGVPCDPFRIDACAWGYRHIEGGILHLLDGARCGQPFFLKLEQVARGIHARGIVHLDLRNARNVLVDAQDNPHVIDFQSALPTRRLPSAIRRHLERIDLSGVYKHWLIRDGATLGAGRERILYWQLRLRHWWPFRGYRLPGRRALYHEEVAFLQRCRRERRRTTAPGASAAPENHG